MINNKLLTLTDVDGLRCRKGYFNKAHSILNSFIDLPNQYPAIQHITEICMRLGCQKVFSTCFNYHLRLQKLSFVSKHLKFWLILSVSF